jgi:hypothetical protein
LERSPRSPELGFTSLKNAVLAITKLATARMSLTGRLNKKANASAEDGQPEINQSRHDA